MIINFDNIGGGGGGSYTLPTASQSTKGGVKVGSGLTMSGETMSIKAGDGLAFSGDTLIASGSTYVLPTASQDTLGGVKIGSGITIDANGAISAQGGGTFDKLNAVSELPASAETGDVVALSTEPVPALPYGITAELRDDIGEYQDSTGLRASVPSAMTEADIDHPVFLGNAVVDGYRTYGLYVFYDSENGIVFVLSSDGNMYDPDFSVYPGDEGLNDSSLGIFIYFYGADNDKVYEVYSDGNSSVSFSDVPQDVPGVLDIYQYDGSNWKAVGGNIFTIYDTYANNAALANFLFQYWDENGLYGQLSSGYPKESTHIYLWLGQDFQGAFYQSGFGFVELQPQVFSDEEGMVVFLTGVFGDKDMNAYLYRQGYRQNGDAYGCYLQMIGEPPVVPQVASVAFGNGDIGGLSYNTSTGLFTLGGVDYASGDTTTPVQDVYDYQFVVNGLLTRAGEYSDDYGNVYRCINAHTLIISDNGEDFTLTSPSISMKGITSYTVDDIEFNRELTFNYGDWKLIMDVAESNVGINLRVQHI